MIFSAPLQGAPLLMGIGFRGLRTRAACGPGLTPGFHEGVFVKTPRRISPFFFLCPFGHRVSLSGRADTLPFFHPVKRRRALLASNPPRVSRCRKTGSAAFGCGASFFCRQRLMPPKRNEMACVSTILHIGSVLLSGLSKLFRRSFLPGLCTKVFRHRLVS